MKLVYLSTPQRVGKLLVSCSMADATIKWRNSLKAQVFIRKVFKSRTNRTRSLELGLFCAQIFFLTKYVLSQGEKRTAISWHQGLKYHCLVSSENVKNFWPFSVLCLVLQNYIVKIAFLSPCNYRIWFLLSTRSRWMNSV